jgi:hypothetical protein
MLSFVSLLCPFRHRQESNFHCRTALVVVQRPPLSSPLSGGIVIREGPATEEEENVGCDGYCRTAEAAVLETGTLLVG